MKHLVFNSAFAIINFQNYHHSGSEIALVIGTMNGIVALVTYMSIK